MLFFKYNFEGEKKKINKLEYIHFLQLIINLIYYMYMYNYLKINSTHKFGTLKDE